VSGAGRIAVTTVVAVSPKDAFEIFTREVDAWWRRGPRFRWNPERDGVLRFEPGVGGRLVEVYDEAQGQVFEVGRVRAWEPGERLVFGFRARSFEPDQDTEVEVRFEAVPEGTRVSVEHRGWEALPEGHPARHGMDATAFRSMMDVWWGDQLHALRSHPERGRARSERRS
jgi:hypothetical protein